MENRIRTAWKQIFLAAALLVPASVQCVRAADLTAFIGGVKPGSLSISNITTSLDSSPIYGVRIGWNFVPLLGTEHTVAFSSGFLVPSSLSDITNSKGFVYNANLILGIPIRHIVPYATAGIGLMHQYGSPDFSIGTRFAVNYGGGIKFPHLLGPLGLRFDARGYTAVDVFSQNLNLLEVSGGVLISF